VRVADLEAHARQGLARYEVPSAWWIRATSLPLNASGKVLRREVRREWLELGGTTQDERAVHPTA
jgi:acyl-CoA synthetase (AMP-forming)/AMP-acid ligase II